VPFTRVAPTVPLWEEELLSLEKVCTYLAEAPMVPRRQAPMASLAKAPINTTSGSTWREPRVALRFDPEAMVLICLPEGCEETIRLPIQGITKAELMGELAVLQSLPTYQLALPFSLAAWRQLEYVQNLTARLCETCWKMGRYDFMRLDNIIIGLSLFLLLIIQ
jgi:hypothetical protein